MRNLFYIILLCTSLLSAQNGFERGNELYRKEKYAEAVTAYESVLKTKQHSAELYFNLGNAYYKLNKIAPAIYNYEKALLLSPGDRDIENNLKFAHKMMIDEVKEVPKVGFKKMIGDITSGLSYNGWAWLAVSCAISFLVFFCGYYFSSTALLKRIFFVGMIALALIILLSIIAAIFEKDRYKSERPAIVFATSAPVKSEPKPGASDAIVLHEGTKVYVLESLENWRRVELPDGSDGWMESSAIKEVK
jgi:tetratricopeptide (TPR) repeat protein